MALRLAVAVLVLACALSRPARGDDRVAVDIGGRAAGSFEVSPFARDTRAQDQAARHRDIAATLNPAGAVRRVLYPMSGADAFTPFTVFGGRGGPPDTVVMVDAEPFGSARDLRAGIDDPRERDSFLHYLKPVDGPWVGRSYVNQAQSALRRGGVGRGVLWELARLGPSSLSVEMLDDRGRPLDDERAEPRAARVRFELGGRTRELLYVRHRIGAEDTPPILEDFLQSGYHGFLEKAAGDTWHGSPLARFAARAIRHLDRERGVMLTDDLQYFQLARLGLVPLDVVGELDTRFGYMGRYDVPYKNPVLRPTRRSERQRTIDGLAYLEEFLTRSEADKEALAALTLATQTDMLERLAAQAERVGVRWPRRLPASREALRQVLLARVGDVADGERIGYSLRAMLEELGPPTTRGSASLVYYRMLRQLRRGARAPYAARSTLDQLAARGRITPSELVDWRRALLRDEASGQIGREAAARLGEQLREIDRSIRLRARRAATRRR